MDFTGKPIKLFLKQGSHTQLITGANTLEGIIQSVNPDQTITLSFVLIECIQGKRHLPLLTIPGQDIEDLTLSTPTPVPQVQPAAPQSGLKNGLPQPPVLLLQQQQRVQQQDLISPSLPSPPTFAQQSIPTPFVSEPEKLPDKKKKSKSDSEKKSFKKTEKEKIKKKREKPDKNRYLAGSKVEAEDFDFEKNLQMFDKQKVFSQFKKMDGTPKEERLYTQNVRVMKKDTSDDQDDEEDDE